MPFTSLTGAAIPFGRRDVDTDLIIPARFMKTLTRSGLGAGAFEALRAEPGNLFDQPRYRGAPILIAGENFGCGSSREHAVWALADLGLRAIVAPSFADIFAGNALQNGLLLVELAAAEVESLMSLAADHPVSIDLPAQTVSAAAWRRRFEIEPGRKARLLAGLDEIALTQRCAPEIEAYWRQAAAARPWLAPSAGAAHA